LLYLENDEEKEKKGSKPLEGRKEKEKAPLRKKQIPGTRSKHD
jgi:hypothetical protein